MIQNYEHALSYYEKSIYFGRISIGSRSVNGIVSWGIIKNRAYLRSIHGKILTLEKLGRFTEEIAEIEKLLALNPADNLGIRYRLIHWKIMNNDLLGAERLLTQFKDDFTPFIIYTSALVLYHQIRIGESPFIDPHKTVLEAVKCNPYVPNLLFHPNYSYSLPEMPPGFSSSEKMQSAKDYLGYYHGRQLWYQFDGALQWLQTMLYPNGFMIPTESDFLELLSFRKVLVAFANQGDKLITRCKDSMVGSGTENFCLPEHFDARNRDGQICVFEETPGWKDNGFKMISFDKIESVPSWEPLLAEVRRDNTPIPCPPYLCAACHDPLPVHTRRRTYESEKDTKSKQKLKSLRCESCRALRFAASLCEQCNVHCRQFCKKCQGVYYCSRECQKANFSIHKRSCIRRNISTNMARLSENVFTSDLLTHIVEYLVGSGSPAHGFNSVDIIRFSRVSKKIRNRFLTVPLWTHLSIQVDLDIVESFEEEMEIADWNWTPLKHHSTSIVGTFLRYGGSKITALALRMRVLEDSALHLIATTCPLLTRVELMTSPYNDCKFPSSAGLTVFFALVSPLTHLKISYQETGEREIISESVLRMISSRSFPLEALSLDLTPKTVQFLAPYCPTLKALQWKGVMQDRNEAYDTAIMNRFVTSIQGSIFHRMQILWLQRCTGMTDHALREIAAAMPNLRDLDIGLFNADPTLTDAGLLALAKCRSLKCLDIGGRSSITLSGLLRMLQKDHPMKELSIQDTAICSRSRGAALLANLRKIIQSAPSILVLWYSDPNIQYAFDEGIGLSKQLYPLMTEFPQIFFCNPSFGLVKYAGTWSAEARKVRMSEEQMKVAQYGVNSVINDGVLRVCGFASEKWST